MTRQLSPLPSAAAAAAGSVPPRDVCPSVSHPCLSGNVFCQQIGGMIHAAPAHVTTHSNDLANSAQKRTLLATLAGN